MKTLVIILHTFILFIITLANSGISLATDQSLSTHKTLISNKNSPALPSHLKMIGQTRFSVWFWDVYDVTLKNINGQYQQQNYPMLMQLDYLRDIKSTDLVEETQKQWNRFKINQAQQMQWLAQLQKILPDINQGDSISFFIDTNGHGHFFYNQQFTGSIRDSEFSYHFLNIWVAPDSPYPQMTQALTGQD